MRAQRLSPVRLIAALALPILSATLWAPAARAQQSEADKLFDEGAKLMKAGRVAEACPKFEQSNKLDPEIGGLLWLADCYERNGQTASSYRTYKDAQKMAIERKDRQQRDKVAQKHITSLEKKLSKLTILAPAEKPEGLEVTRDGEKLGDSDLGLAVPVDPGAHVVVATAPHYRKWTKNISVGTDGSAETITVGPLEKEEAPPPPPPPEEPKSDPAFAYHVGGIVVAAAGLVGVGIGSVLGLVAAGKLSDSNADNHCDLANTCDALGLQLRSEAKDAALVSTIAFIAGGVAIAAGITVYFLAPKKSHRDLGRTYFAPLIGSGTYGAAFGGTF
jgi:tetratricopeptide (TPR) repeat protein